MQLLSENDNKIFNPQMRGSVNQGLLSEKQTLSRENLVKMIREWGDVNSDGLLESDCHAFQTPDIEGFIGYKLESYNAVVFGDPVCAKENKAALAKAFEAYCTEKNLGVVYTIVSEEFARFGQEEMKGVAIEFGTLFVLNPFNNPTHGTGSKAVLVRKKVKAALNAGTIFKEYLGDDPVIEKAIEEVSYQWLNKRSGPQIYLCHVTLFNDRYGKRWFYAEHNNKIVGLLVLNKLGAQGGWLLNNVMLTPNAPKGLSEFLIISTLEQLEKEGCHFVIAGPVPLQEIGTISGIGEVGAKVIRYLFKAARVFFRLGGHGAFWEKFMPETKSSYLLFPNKNLRFSSIKDLMQAFNVGKG